jgi:hypothetical protein
MKSLVAIILGLTLLGPSAAAAMGPVDLSAEVGLYNRYLWRGLTLMDNLVLQPELSAGLGGFGLALWGNFDADDADGTSGFNEYDATLSYGLSLPTASFNLGVIYYAYPEASTLNTTEAFASASAGVLLSPTLTVYRDLDLFRGWYWEAGVSHGLPLSPVANLELSARVGLGSERYLAGYFPPLAEGAAAGSLTDASITLALPWNPVPLATITPSLSWSTLLGDAGTNIEDAGGDNDMAWGLTAAVSF